MDWPTNSGIFDLGDLPLDLGATLPGARLGWKTHGTLSPARDNAILYPTSYGAQHPELEWLIAPDGVLDPTRWFVIQVDQFGNGVSTSPSNAADYPALVTVADNARAQARMLDAWGIQRLACAYGWSMGALQAYHWAAHFPDRVERIVVNCGVARTAVHNQVFLASLMAVLEAAPEWQGGGGSARSRGPRCAHSPASMPDGRSARTSTGPGCTWRRPKREGWGRRTWKRSWWKGGSGATTPSRPRTCTRS